MRIRVHSPARIAVLVFGVALSMAVIYVSSYALLRWQQVLVVSPYVGCRMTAGSSISRSEWYMPGFKIDNSFKTAIAARALPIFMPLCGIECRYRNRDEMLVRVREESGVLLDQSTRWRWVLLDLYSQPRDGNVSASATPTFAGGFGGSMGAPQTADR